MAWVKVQKANKDYNCSGGCGDIIPQGTHYVRVTNLELDDVDINELGVQTRSPRPRDDRQFNVQRFHKGCADGVN
jgi:hypothetical protein